MKLNFSGVYEVSLIPSAMEPMQSKTSLADHTTRICSVEETHFNPNEPLTLNDVEITLISKNKP